MTTDETHDVGATTDVAHWDRLLRSRAETPKRYPSWHAVWGRRGVFIELMERHCGPLWGRRIVELGGACSVRLLSLARFRNCEVVAVDFSQARLDATEALFAAHGASVECVHADMFAFEADPFDVVTHWGVIEHFDRPAAVLGASARLVRPEGTVVFGMPNMNAWGARLWRQHAPASWATHIYHSDEVISEACAESNLDLTARFHWGAPLLKIVEWEDPNRWLRMVSACQIGAFGLGKVLPIFKWGNPRISTERAFVARPHRNSRTR